jgi:hypothetical protein
LNWNSDKKVNVTHLEPLHNVRSDHAQESTQPPTPLGEPASVSSREYRTVLSDKFFRHEVAQGPGDLRMKQSIPPPDLHNSDRSSMSIALLPTDHWFGG